MIYRIILSLLLALQLSLASAVPSHTHVSGEFTDCAMEANGQAVWVHNDCFDINKIRPESGLSGSKKHGVGWSEQDALSRARSTNTPQGKFGSQHDLDYITTQVRNLGGDTGKVTAGIKKPIPLPGGHSSKVFFPDGSSATATHVWVRVNKSSGTLHMYPIVKP